MEIKQEDCLSAYNYCEYCPFQSNLGLFKHHALKHRRNAVLPSSSSPIDWPWPPDVSTMKNVNFLTPFNCSGVNLETYSLQIDLKSNFMVDFLTNNSLITNDLEENLYFCDSCNFQTYSRFILSLHRVSHKFFKCDHCDYKSLRKCNIRRHIKYRHVQTDQIKWYKCDHCQLKFKWKVSLTRHVEMKHIYNDSDGRLKCQFCLRTFKALRYLSRHILRQHETVKQKLKCLHCDYKTMSMKLFSRHRNKHVQKPVIEWHQCDRCDFRTKTKDALRKHVKSVHFANKTLTCDHCIHGFNNISHLRSHILRKHSKKVWLQCEQCDFKTLYESFFKRHQNRHKERASKWYECAFCDFRAKYNHNVTLHTNRVHKKAVLHQCPHCDAHFTNLNRHVQDCHSTDDEFECGTCGYRANGRSSLVQHIIETHAL